MKHINLEESLEDNFLKQEDESLYKIIKEKLEKFPFITIIAKYDHILGPRALYSSVPVSNENFIRILLRDALNTRNKFVIIDFIQFYSQIYKVYIEDETARGGKQLYAIIMLRDVEYPIIPILHFKKIAMMFYKIDKDKILGNDIEAFEKFFQEINEIYMNKDEILPTESVNLQIRSGVNTIQGFCELIKEQKINEGSMSEQELINYIEMMIESCSDIIEALEKI